MLAAFYPVLAAFYPVLAAFIAMLAAFLAMLAAFLDSEFFSHLRKEFFSRLIISCSVKCTLQPRVDYGGMHDNSRSASRVVFFGAPGECRGIFSPLGASTRPSSLRHHPRTPDALVFSPPH